MALAFPNRSLSTDDRASLRQSSHRAYALFHTICPLALMPRATCLVPGCDGVVYAALPGKEALGQVLHGSARTTAAVRRALQQSQESLNAMGLNT